MKGFLKGLKDSVKETFDDVKNIVKKRKYSSSNLSEVGFGGHPPKKKNDHPQKEKDDRETDEGFILLEKKQSKPEDDNFYEVDVTDLLDNTKPMNYEEWLDFLSKLASERRIMAKEETLRRVLKSVVKEGVPKEL